MVFLEIPNVLKGTVFAEKVTNVTRPGKIGLIYTKYSCSYYGTYILFCMCYSKSVSFIEFLIDFCIYDDIIFRYNMDSNKKLLHFKLSKSAQILSIDKIGFYRPSHKCTLQMYSNNLAT